MHATHNETHSHILSVSPLHPPPPHPLSLDSWPYSVDDRRIDLSTGLLILFT